MEDVYKYLLNVEDLRQTLETPKLLVMEGGRTETLRVFSSCAPNTATVG